MTPRVKKLLKAATADKLFQSELKIHEPEYYKPGLFWSSTEKNLYAAIYMGWLIGKGIYDEKMYW